MRRALMLTVLTLLLVMVGVGLYYPKVDRVEVLGNAHYSAEQIKQIAGVHEGSAFFRVTRWQAAGLLRDPWIAKARIYKHYPDTVSITVWERSPAVIQGETIYALDGTVLPDAPTEQSLIKLEGWGELNIKEALELVNLLVEFEPKVVSYSPAGYEIELADTVVYTPNVEVLKMNWSALLSQRGSRLAVYPWGVSIANE